MKAFLTWLFTAPDHLLSFGERILWWEKRRIPYNLIVGSVALVSLLAFYFFITHTDALQPGEDAVEPLAIIIAPVIMNIWSAGFQPAPLSPR